MEGVSDADLEAELLALEGKSPAKGKSGKTGKSGMLSMGELDAMVAGIGDISDEEEGEEGEEGELSDEDELLGELQVSGRSLLLATCPNLSSCCSPVLDRRG